MKKKSTGYLRQKVYELIEEITGKKLSEKYHKKLSSLLKEYVAKESEHFKDELKEAYITNQKLRAGTLKVSHKAALNARKKLKKRGIDV